MFAIHTKKVQNQTLDNTFQVFNSALNAFEIAHDMVYKQRLFGAYIIDSNGDCIDKVENLNVKYGFNS